VRLVEKLTKDKLEIQPWQAIPERMAAAGLSPEDGTTQVWYVAPDGRLSGGAAATNAALALVWWLRPLTWLYRLPGLRQIEDRVYRWVADNRYRMPGSTAACAVPVLGDEVATDSAENAPDTA
jgi:predicted DCC family thiol-disulfide oxidoreductase YuxK